MLKFANGYLPKVVVDYKLRHATLLLSNIQGALALKRLRG